MSTFRALKNPNYRLFFIGQGISLNGTWMQQVALSWLAYRLTGSELMLGIVAFAGQIPSFIAMPLGGALADRSNRQKLMVITQVLAMIQSLALAGLTMTGHITITHVLILNVLGGIITAIDMPTRQSFVVEMVEKPSDLGNAIALNSSLFNGTRLIGPAFAGAIIAWAGEGVCFLINGISYIAVIAALLMMKVKPRQQAAEKAPLLHHIKEGWRYAFGFAPIRAIIIFMALVSLIGMPYTVLLPVFAKDILHGGPQTLGLLTGASGAGALVAALMLASRKQVLGLGRWVILGSGVFGTGIVLLSFTKTLAVSMPAIAITGFGMITQMGAMNIILQSLLDEDKRGRVMSLYTLAFMGMMPLGSLLAGWSGEHIGVPHTIFYCGILTLMAALWLAAQMPQLREAARPVYIAKGIINDIPAPIPENKA